MDGGGTKSEIIAKVQEMKAAPHHGQKRLVVRETGKLNSHSVIDITMKESMKIEEKGTYRFQVEEKNANRPAQSTTRMNSGFKSYSCDDTPTPYEGGSGTNFDRFGGGTRTKF